MGKQIENVAGKLVAVFAYAYVASLMTKSNLRYPQIHTGVVIAGSVLVFPFIFKTSPAWYSFPMQVTVSVLILILDWFSFHEDKTRFSEENLCLTGPCRRNSMITGNVAHWGDVIGMALLLVSHTKPQSWPAIIGGWVVYGLVGTHFIDEMTKDGSVSDLRTLTEDEKCKQARMMRDGWRGCLNDLITILGIMVAWQSLFVCNGEQCRSVSQRLRLEQQISNLRAVVLVLVAVIPTLTNFVNTSAQHGGLPAEHYGLPPCFDD